MGESGAGARLLIVATVSDTIRAFLLPYADHFRALGWRVDAMAGGISESPELASHFDAVYDAKWSRNPLAPGNLIGTPGRIREIVRAGGYDIVHVHTPVASFVTRLALRRARASGRPKVVYTAHGFHFFKGGKWSRNMVFKGLERCAAKWTDRLIVINSDDLECAVRSRIMPSDRVVHMPGIGLDFAAYSPEGTSPSEVRQTRDEIGLKADDILFTMTAEFNPGKRHADVITALSRIKDSSVHVAFAGGGPLRDKIQNMARAFVVHQRTHFLGHVKDPKPLMLASRATIMPSEREGLSRSAMESICLGIPVIGSNARGVKDVIQPHRGLVFPTGDCLALRDAMQQLREEPYPPVTP
ncbi:MAG: glycosyltransferase, partial [Synergistaceae bacterium]|nr:glycosyltransferase [Synergistaceae bacterium]